jgi:hypothetical protein
VVHGGDPANPLVGSLRRSGATAVDKAKIAETIKALPAQTPATKKGWSPNT